MVEPEREDERRSRGLEELKGKNVAHYSVLLTAWIQTRMERDKTLVTLASAGIGLLITMISIRGVDSSFEIVLHALAFAGFLTTIMTALTIYQRNAMHIENELREIRTADLKLDRFDKLSYWSFVSAIVCVILIGLSSGWSKYMAGSEKKASHSSTRAFFRSLSGIEKLNPNKKESLPQPTTPAKPQTPYNSQGAPSADGSDDKPRSK